MDTLQPFVKPVVFLGIPTFVLALVVQRPAVSGAVLSLLFLVTLVRPGQTTDAFKDFLEGFLVFVPIVVTAAAGLLGAGLYYVGLRSGTLWMMLVGAGVAFFGGKAARNRVLALLVEPAPPLTVRTAPLSALPKPSVVLARATQSPPPPKPVKIIPPPKPFPREFVWWGGTRYPAKSIDEFFYAIWGPPGRGKTTIEREMVLPMIQEVLDPRCQSTLIVFDPKKEMHQFIASLWPQNQPVPLHLFCPSDRMTVTLDWDRDFNDLASLETFALSLFPKNAMEHQPFFPNATRTLIEAAIHAIRQKLGTWDLRVLTLVLSNPGYLKTIVGRERSMAFVAELLSVKSSETAQNIIMELISKISKWRKVAAHLSLVDKSKALSLKQFLRNPGVLVIQKDAEFSEQHDAMNAMLFQKIGRILMSMPKDPTGKRKIYIVVDEFPSLGYFEGFIDMCRELRSRGVVFVLCWQSWANIVDVWKDKASSLKGCLQNFMILGSADMTDSEHAAKLVGKVRGWEPQVSRGRNSGRSRGETDGTSDATNSGWSKTRRADFAGIFGHTQQFIPTDTSSGGSSHSTNHSLSRNYSKGKSENVTWVYYDRDIKSPTDLMRMPIPTPETGFHGIAYKAGEPMATDFVLGSDLVESFQKPLNDFIEDYRPWSESDQVIEELTHHELRRLGLQDVAPEDPEAYPTQEQALEMLGHDWAERYDKLMRNNTGRKPTPRPLVDFDEGDWDANPPEL